MRPQPGNSRLRVQINAKRFEKRGTFGDYVVNGVTRHYCTCSIDPEKWLLGDVLAENLGTENLPERWRLVECIPWLARDTRSPHQVLANFPLAKVVSQRPERLFFEEAPVFGVRNEHRVHGGREGAWLSQFAAGQSWISERHQAGVQLRGGSYEN
jgi:hypothetical protein